MLISVNYNYIIVNRDKDKNLLSFSSRKNTKLRDVVQEVLKYLDELGFEDEYNLTFDGKTIAISKNSTVKEIREKINNITLGL